MGVDELDLDDQGDDDDVGVDDVGIVDFEIDDQGRALLSEHWGWCGRDRKLQVELT